MNNISRKRRSEKVVPVKAEDHIAWMQNGGNGRELVRRSPIDRSKWLPLSEFESIMAELEAKNAFFETRKGPYAILDPKDGQPGWQRVVTCKMSRRLPFVFENGGWVAQTRRDMSPVC